MLNEPIGLIQSKDKAVLLFRQDRVRLLSERQQNILNSIRYTTEMIEELDEKISRSNKNIDDITCDWLLNRKVLSSSN